MITQNELEEKLNILNERLKKNTIDKKEYLNKSLELYNQILKIPRLKFKDKLRIKQAIHLVNTGLKYYKIVENAKKIKKR